MHLRAVSRILLTVLTVVPTAQSAAAMPADTLVVFEENRGQAEKHIRFLARRGALLLEIERDAFRLSIPSGDWIRFSFIGGNGTRIFGESPLPGKRNYFVDPDPRRWATNIPTWERVRIGGLYSGIDLVFRSASRELEYDFLVDPGADASQIAIRVDGTIQLAKDGDDLVASTSQGVVFRHPSPRTFQKDAEITSTWELNGQELRVRTGEYDRTTPLVIDPPIVASTYIGGGSGDQAHAVAVDADGNIYIGGETYSTDYPIQGGVQSVNKSPAERDAFITKLDPTGRTVIYSTYFGGNAYDIVEAIAVDATGAVYFAGGGYSLDLPVSANAFQKTANIFVGEDGFLVKLSPAGDRIVYCTYLRANSEKASSETIRSLAVDGAGNAYVAGDTTDPTWPITAGAFRTSGCGGHSDAFVTKVNADGSNLIYSTYLCGSDFDRGNDITVDAAGNAYIVGTTTSADFPQAGVPVTVRGNDAWLTKLNSTGSALLASTLIGGSDSDTGVSLTVEQDGSVYVTGITNSPDLPTTAGFQRTPRARNDSYVMRLTPDLKVMSATYLGGRDDDNVEDIAIAGKNIVVAGTTFSSDFPLFGATQSTYGGARDAFVSIFDASLRQLVFSTFIGGTSWDQADSVAVDATGAITVTGFTFSTNFPTVNAYRSSFAGGSDAFVVKFAGPPPVPPRRRSVRH